MSLGEKSRDVCWRRRNSWISFSRGCRCSGGGGDGGGVDVLDVICADGVSVAEVDASGVVDVASGADHDPSLLDAVNSGAIVDVLHSALVSTPIFDTICS